MNFVSKPSRLLLGFLFSLLVASAPGRGHAEPPAELPPVQELPPLLTLEEALRLLRTHGLDLLIADANVASMAADVAVAGAVQNPTLSGSIIKSFNYNPNDPNTCPAGSGCSDLGWTVGLSEQALWDVVTGKRGLRLKTARTALAAARLSRKDAERTLAFQLKQQFVQVALAQRALGLYGELAEAAAQTAELNRQRYEAGAISEVDLAKAQTDAMEAQQLLDNAHASLRQQQIGLAFLLGARGPVPSFKVDFELVQHQDSGAMADRAQLIAQAMEQRPDLKAQATQRERARAALEAAYRQRVPDGAINVLYQQQGNGQTAIQPPTLSVGLQLTLPIFSQNQGGIRRSQADVSLQAAQYAKLQAQISSDVESSANALDLNRRLIARLETGLLERATRTRDLQRLRYQKGAASLLEYIDAQRVYSASYQAYFQALANYWTARFQLDQALGL